jgi:hypothetical protein
MGGVFAYIIYDVLKKGGADYINILIFLVLALLLIGMDYHFTNCVVFYWKHPPKKKGDINWIDSDSEPQFAF